MSGHYRIVEYNTFLSLKKPLVYYIPCSCLSTEEIEVLFSADHRIFDPVRYEGNGFERDYTEPVSRAMSLIKKKSEYIVDEVPENVVDSIVFMYANLEPPHFAT